MIFSFDSDPSFEGSFVLATLADDITSEPNSSQQVQQNICDISTANRTEVMNGRYGISVNSFRLAVRLVDFCTFCCPKYFLHRFIQSDKKNFCSNILLFVTHLFAVFFKIHNLLAYITIYSY